MPKINIQNIHHTVIYECDRTYYGNPEFKPGECTMNPVKGAHCRTSTHTYFININIYNKHTNSLHS